MIRRISCAVFLLALLMLSGCQQPQNPDTQSSTQPTPTIPEPTGISTGWYEEQGHTYYRLPDGTFLTGKVTIGEETYYFDATGIRQTGLVELDGSTYYFRPNGTMARGQVEIDGYNRFFSSTGKEVLVVNPWNPLPENYDLNLVNLDSSLGKEGSQISQVCLEDLLQMLNDCNAECPRVYVVSSYRSYDYQAGLFENRIARFQAEGYSREEAEILAAAVVARPGTSEHHTGLALDIIDTRSWNLDETQAQLPGQQWLMANSWRYGFVLRYPEGTTDSTGIIYEPWHYRYVGKELAKELYDSGLTLEQYLENLTQ